MLTLGESTVARSAIRDPQSLYRAAGKSRGSWFFSEWEALGEGPIAEPDRRQRIEGWQHSARWLLSQHRDACLTVETVKKSHTKIPSV